MLRTSPESELHLLVVDDNLVHRRMSQTLLSAAGYRVTLAEGGPQALLAFAKASIDVVLLDVHMPGMDGFEVCRRLRALPFGKRVPILLLTDVSDLASPEQAFSSGADDFLNKPINRTELFMRIRSLLRARHQESILDGLLSASRDAIALLDDKGQITKWSQEAESLLGFPAGDAVGKSLSNLLLPADQQPSFDDGLARYLTTGNGSIVNHRTASSASTQGGSRQPIELYITAVRTANVTAFCAFLRDAGAAKARA